MSVPARQRPKTRLETRTARRSAAAASAAEAVLRDPRWRAVAARDAAADGRFYYSVTTTGVYCRPGCPARRPRPEHVRFHPTRDAAERAGFRPCRRCRPDRASLGERRAAMVAEACRILDSAETPPTLEGLAAELGSSPHHFHRVFRRATGLTPRAYAAARREQRVRDALAGGAGVTDAIFAAGYNSSSRFYSTSEAVLGMRPTAYRSGGAGESIRFAVGRCALGHVLVARSDAGVCAILLGDDPEALAAELERRFPAASRVAHDPELEAWLEHVVAFVEAPRDGLALPLDVRGTAFQKRVWQALREIPAGTVASYAEIAERIGAPGAARAVGAACAANPVALAVPCHRAVRSDGSPGGYRWGVERKRALLEREAHSHSIVAGGLPETS